MVVGRWLGERWGGDWERMGAGWELVGGWLGGGWEVVGSGWGLAGSRMGAVGGWLRLAEGDWGWLRVAGSRLGCWSR